MDNDTPLKRCSKCGIEYPSASEYFNKHSDKQGLRPDCRSCRSKTTKKYYQSNKEHVIQRTTEYQKTHPELRRQISRRHYNNHREQELARTSEYKVRNPDKVKAYPSTAAEYRREYGRRRHAERRDELNAQARAYYAQNKGKALMRWRKRRAQKINAGGSHTQADIELQFKSQKGLCWWCGEPIEEKYHVDHRVPLDKGGSNDARNIVIAHPKCNLEKHNKLPHEYNGRLL